VLAVHELVGAAFVDAAHAWIVGDQSEDLVEFAQIFARLPLTEGLVGIN